MRKPDNKRPERAAQKYGRSAFPLGIWDLAGNGRGDFAFFGALLTSAPGGFVVEDRIAQRFSAAAEPVSTKRRRSTSSSASRSGWTLRRSRISDTTLFSSPSVFGSSGSPSLLMPTAARTSPSFT